ncbi:MAG: hypothetical protein IPO36_14645 [Anaerolineales bacterium]|nr:hypothetical protein [Anaerolineales bacterium]
MDPRLTPQQQEDALIEDALQTYPLAPMPRDITASVMARIQASRPRCAQGSRSHGMILPLPHHHSCVVAPFFTAQTSRRSRWQRSAFRVFFASGYSCKHALVDSRRAIWCRPHFSPPYNSYPHSNDLKPPISTRIFITTHPADHDMSAGMCFL